MKGIALYPTHAERVEIEDFRDMQKIVGGYLDLVSLNHIDMYVNDSFLFEYDLDKDLNFCATALALTNGRPDLVAVLGPVVIVGPADDEGNNTDLKEGIAQKILSLAGTASS